MKVKSLSRVQLFATPWTAAYQAPPSMGVSRQEHWSGVPLPSAVLEEEESGCPPVTRRTERLGVLTTVPLTGGNSQGPQTLTADRGRRGYKSYMMWMDEKIKYTQ